MPRKEEMRRIFLFILSGASLWTSSANVVDSISADTISLREFTVAASAPRRETVPVQTLAGEQLRRLNSNSIADAMRYFSGVQVKDYGGVGGIKTVNVRSMGTNHTGVVYDGVALGNAQNGQIDLGQFSLDNMEALSLHNGQKSALLQPARDFGSAATIYMRTRVPHFGPGEKFHLRGTVRTGSFDLINPSVAGEFRLSNTVNTSVSAEWLKSSGKYKFRYRRVKPDGGIAYDTTATRQNGDINALRAEVNFNGATPGGDWHAKVYHYNSERGIPGAIVNNVWRRGERIWDNNTFVQGRFSHSQGRWSTMNNAKYAYYHTHYVNNDDRQIKVDNRYRQQEVYISTANVVTLTRQWWASASYDFQWNTMSADLRDFSRPVRFTNMLSLATAADFGRVRAQASGLLTLVNDEVKGKPSSSRNVFTPEVYVTAYPFECRNLSARLFYKRSFRMPTFNDLYYTDTGNSSLKPERVDQYNFGLVYGLVRSGFLRGFRVSTDVYYNRVKDKIIAYPKGQQFRWTMLNLGLVDIKGVDASASATVEPVRELEITVRGQYTYQRAIDVTRSTDSYYRHQIPYIPRHSGSAVLNASWRKWGLNYSYIYVGERYNQQENTSYNHMRAWHTHDISVSRDFVFGKIRARVLAEVNNLLSQDYDVILNYPMPKRNFRFTFTVEI